MYQLLFRLPVLLVLSGVCCPLMGQNTNISSKKATTTSANPLKTHWLDTQLDIRRIAPAAVNLAPTGDVRLRRFGTTVFEFDSIPVGDTIQLLLVNKTGIPFKKIEFLRDTNRQTARGLVEYKFRGARSPVLIPPAMLKPVLRIKPAFSLKRQTAYLRVQHRAPARSDSLFNITEIQIKTNRRGNPDTLIRRWQAAPRGNPTLTGEESRKEDSSGRIVHTIRQLEVTRFPNKSDTLPGGLHLLHRLKKTVLRYDAFQPGDTLVFSVKVAGKKPLKEIYLADDKDRRISGAVDAGAFDYTLVAGTEKFVTLHLKSKPGLKKQYAEISVRRIRPARSDSSFVLRDSSIYRLDTIIQYDTLLVTIKDDSLLLAPLLDIESEPFDRLDLEIPKQAPGAAARLFYVAYWVGVGADCIAQYEALEKTVPADWSRPGAPVALGAYGMGRPLSLPPVYTSDVAFVFNQTGSRIGQKQPVSLFGLSLRQNVNTISIRQLNTALGDQSTVYRFFACFQNKSKVNTHPVRLKVIGYYRKEKSRRVEPKPIEPKPKP